MRRRASGRNRSNNASTISFAALPARIFAGLDLYPLNAEYFLVLYQLDLLSITTYRCSLLFKGMSNYQLCCISSPTGFDALNLSTSDCFLVLYKLDLLYHHFRVLSINIVPRSNLSPTLPCQYISRIAHPSRFSSTLYILNTMLFSFLKKLCTSSTGLFSIFHLSYIPSFMIPMLMIHPPPASSYSPFHVPQVFLLHFPSSSATAAFPPTKCDTSSSFSLPTPATAEASLYSLLGVQNVCCNSSSSAAAAAPPPPQSTIVVGW